MLLDDVDAISRVLHALQHGAGIDPADQTILQDLIEAGYPIDLGDSTGMVKALPRLQEAISPLAESELASQFSDGLSSKLESFMVFPAIESTNSFLLNKPLSAGKVAVCLTESQLAGRGRRGAEWVSAPYRNVLLSVAYSFPAWPSS
ncbi:MAG: hypothetical protein AAF197_13355, partial [Pseudomonadota bacterium]